MCGFCVKSLFCFLYARSRILLIEFIRHVDRIEGQMTQSQFQTDLEVPSVNHFCIYCKKILKDSLRIIAKLNNDAKNYINLCPSCLASQEPQVMEYKICGKMNEVVDSLNNLTMETALSCIETVEKNGIQTVELMRETQEEENQLKQQYLELNKKIFQPNEIGFLEPEPKYEVEQSKPILREKNSANRKHLKALGYNWERQEFENQPESVFGILLSTLAREDYEDQQYDKLSSILYRQYMKEQEQFSQIKDYLVNSMFLLGKKGLNREEGIPDILQDIRSKEEQLKEIIPKVCELINNIQGDSLNKKDKSNEKSSENHSSSKQIYERSRTRDLQKKKHKHSEETQKKKKKQKRKHDLPKRRTSKSKGKQQQEDEEFLPKPKASEMKKQQLQDSEAKQDQIPARRGRGRQKGSINKAKVQEKSLLQANSTSEKTKNKEAESPSQ